MPIDVAPLPSRPGSNPRLRLLLLALMAMIAAALFMGYGLQGNLAYVLQRRGMILATMVVVAFAAGISTVLFQTVSGNRILSPAIMGFEYLFVLIQTGILFFWGEQGAAQLGPVTRFLMETGIMVLFSLTLYLWLFGMRHNSLFLVLLVGIVCGFLFDSLATLMQRLLNPNEFAVLQTRMFATFNIVPNTTLLIISVGICLAMLALLCLWCSRVDVLTLGKENAVVLGLDYKRTVTCLLIGIAVLVSVSTALVGPLTFYGFLVASLTYQCVNSCRHRHLLPGAFFIGLTALVGGQFILQHLLRMETTLAVVINFVGGLLFILVLLKRASL